MFVDEITIHCRGGDGGNGCLSFRREAHVPRGGPDGGDGGHGGCVIVEATNDLSNLAHLIGQKHWNADRGQNGEGDLCTGKGGKDVVIKVPVGTMITDGERGHVLRDMKENNDRIVVAQGGEGGRGNKRFASSTNRAPREHENGEVGQARTIKLELKVIADVGLIGKPNAGKSTLLSRMTRANPEIAAYPFTTKYPNLGIVRIGYDCQFVIADIPGLIEGAHAGVGLGHEFLRHVERTRVFVHLIEPMPMDETDPIENYLHIREELRLYDAELSDRKELVVVTKCELPGAADVAAALAKESGQDVQLISAVTGKGLPDLTNAILQVLRDEDGELSWKPTRRRL